MLPTVKLLLPALIPSWRFFDEIAPSPRIEFAVLENEDSVADGWQELRPRPAHVSVGEMLKRLVWNPRWNASLFLVSCAERLMQHPTDHSEREIVRRIAAEHPTAKYVQFRLVFIARIGEVLHQEVPYVSRVHAL